LKYPSFSDQKEIGSFISLYIYYIINHKYFVSVFALRGKLRTTRIGSFCLKDQSEMEAPMEIDLFSAVGEDMQLSYYESCIFQVLPCEILLKIFSYLDDDLVITGRVCKYWNSVAFKEIYDRGMYDMEVLQDNFKAIREFTRAISLNPLAPAPYFKRGVAHYKESEEEEAIRDINKALSCNPLEVEQHIIRAMQYQIQLDFQSAVREASKAIELDPANGSAYYLRGYNRFDLQDYDGSIADLSLCLKLPYQYKSKVLNCRGWCYKIRGDIEKALSDFTLSSRLNVRYTKPFVNKAIVLSTRKDRPKLLEEEQYLTEYLANTKEGNLGSIYYTRAAIKQQWENYEGAIEDYKLAVQYEYHSLHKAHVSIGWCYEKLHQYEKAIAEYNQAIDLKPKYSIAIEHRAGAKCRSDSKAAEEDCRAAIKVNPKNLSFAYRYLAAVQADNSEYAAAIKSLSDGIKVNPLDTDMLLNRAGYYTCQGDFAMAFADYGLCLKHRPDTYEAWKYRGNVRYATSDLVGAIEDYKSALLLEPDDCAVLNNCAIAYLVLPTLTEPQSAYNEV
jgi:tetratricopeptide (TPR) repeat protein